MRRIWPRWVLVLALGAPSLAPGRATADHPTYLILPSSPSIGYAIPAETPRYAYGWFGVQPRRHWSRHFGYYRNYTQWKLR